MMRQPFIRRSLFVLMLATVFGMTAAAGSLPDAPELTMTPSPLTPTTPVEATPTPSPAGETLPATPAPETRQAPHVQPPTILQVGRIYEGNLTGSGATFLLDAELGQFFLLDVNTTAFDAVIDVYDAENSIVATDDDSGSGNMPQLVFVAPSTGQFRVVVRGFSAGVSGGYILRVMAAAQMLNYGDTVITSHDGIQSKIYMFEAQQNDVINLYANTHDRIDTTLQLLGPDGLEVAYIDDFAGFDPEFRRLQLPLSGRYFVIHAPYSTSAIGTVPLTLEKTEVDSIGVQPMHITMTESTFNDIFNIDVVEGRLYAITLSTSAKTYGTLEVHESSDRLVSSSTYSDTEGMSIRYRASQTGIVRLIVGVNNSLTSSPVDIYLSVRPGE